MPSPMHRVGLRYDLLRTLSLVGLAVLMGAVIGCSPPKPPDPAVDATHADNAPGAIGKAPKAPPNPHPVAPSIQVIRIALERPPNQPVALRTTVRNNGSGTAEISGACGWKCPVVITQGNGFLNTEQGELVGPGQQKVLNGGGGVGSICDGNKLPVQMSCNFTARAFPLGNGPEQTIHYEQTVTPP